MFDNLSERLERSFKILKGEGRITEINVAETLKDVRKALLDADVNYKVAKNFTDTVKTKALGQNVLTAVKPSQLMVKIVHDELTQLMGGETAEINIDSKPAVILMSGLQGSGKTTFSGKLARMLKSKKNRKPLLVACDVYRPAAIKQLEVNGAKQGVPVFTMGDKQNPVDIAKASIEHAKENDNNIVILDTAGRLHVDEDMMDELIEIKENVDVAQTVLVVDAMTGQDAVNVSGTFNDKIGIDGVIAIPHLGASTPESEENCASMGADELIDYLENGNIKNSVNYPACDAGVCATEGRIAVAHKNVHSMLSQFTTLFANDGINIENMVNKSRGDYAYTIFDICNPSTEKLVNELQAIDGVIKVRIVK